MKTHGHCCSGVISPEYGSYYHAKTRCRNPREKTYYRYGGRGIEFRFDSFEEFYKCVGPRPSAQHSIDRIDNDGHYEPGNVRWATKREQVLNRTLRNVNKHGLIGITKDPRCTRHPWTARIQANGTRLRLGYFSSKEEAARAYEAAALKYNAIGENQ